MASSSTAEEGAELLNSVPLMNNILQPIFNLPSILCVSSGHERDWLSTKEGVQAAQWKKLKKWTINQELRVTPEKQGNRAKCRYLS
jgi:hypothetical protein